MPAEVSAALVTKMLAAQIRVTVPGRGRGHDLHAAVIAGCANWSAPVGCGAIIALLRPILSVRVRHWHALTAMAPDELRNPSSSQACRPIPAPLTAILSVISIATDREFGFPLDAGSTRQCASVVIGQGRGGAAIVTIRARYCWPSLGFAYVPYNLC
jgi:hypothetical protein